MKINSKYEKILEFSMLMENVQEEPKINFVIDTGGIKVAFPCVILENDAIRIEIPKLNDYKNIFTETSYPAYIEAIVGESYKVPWECILEIETPSSIIIKSTEAKEKEAVKISIKDIKETKELKETKPKELKETKPKETKETKPKEPKELKELKETKPKELKETKPKVEEKRNIFKEFIKK